MNTFEALDCTSWLHRICDPRTVGPRSRLGSGIVPCRAQMGQGRATSAMRRHCWTSTTSPSDAVGLCEVGGHGNQRGNAMQSGFADEQPNKRRTKSGGRPRSPNAGQKYSRESNDETCAASGLSTLRSRGRLIWQWGRRMRCTRGSGNSTLGLSLFSPRDG